MSHDCIYTEQNKHSLQQYTVLHFPLQICVLFDNGSILTKLLRTLLQCYTTEIKFDLPPKKHHFHMVPGENFNDSLNHVPKLLH